MLLVSGMTDLQMSGGGRLLELLAHSISISEDIHHLIKYNIN